MLESFAVDNLAPGSSASSGCARGGLHIRAMMRVSRVTFTLGIKRCDVDGRPRACIMQPRACIMQQIWVLQARLHRACIVFA